MSLSNSLGGVGEWWIDRGKLFPTRDNYPFHETNMTLPYCDLGLVKIAHDPDKVAVTWDVDQAHPASIDYSQFFLRKRAQAKATSLKFRKSAWATEDLPTEAAIERLSEIQSFRAVDILTTTRIKALKSADISSFDPMIRIAFREWQHDRTSLRAQAIGDYGLFFTPKNENLVFDRVGDLSECRKMLGDEWKDTAIGSPCDSAFADADFDRRISQTYMQCLDEDRPFLEHVHGLIDVGPYAIWLPYQRAVFPLDWGVACFTKITQDISIPFLRAA